MHALINVMLNFPGQFYQADPNWSLCNVTLGYFHSATMKLPKGIGLHSHALKCSSELNLWWHEEQCTSTVHLRVHSVWLFRPQCGQWDCELWALLPGPLPPSRPSSPLPPRRERVRDEPGAVRGGPVWERRWQLPVHLHQRQWGIWSCHQPVPLQG